MRIRPGLPVAVSVALVVTALGVLLASVLTRPGPVAPCPGVEGRPAPPTPSPAVCPGVTVTTAPRPVIVVTGSPQAPVVVREPGETRTVVSVSPSPVPPRLPPSRSPSPTVTPTPSPTCVLPLPPPGCLGRGHIQPPRRRARRRSGTLRGED